MMGEIRVGLIRGRHALPVDEYIFNEELNFPLDYKKLDETVMDFITKKVGIYTTYGLAINSVFAYGEDHQLYRGCKQLVVYVTGLTACTASVIKACARNGVSLTLMHFDPTTGEYSPQVIF